MGYYERDEARHVGLGVQLVPQLMSELSILGAIDLAFFQLDLLVTTLFSLKTIESDLLTLGVDPRTLLGIAFRKQADIDDKIRAEFPRWPDDPPLRRAFEAVCEALFPGERGERGDGRLPMRTRLRHALEVAARQRPSVNQQWSSRGDRAS
jgi:hypothetical protein